MTFPASVIKYINKYSAGGWKLEPENSKLYNNIIVIPAIDEEKNLPILLDSILSNDKKYFGSTLLVFVVNNLKNSSEEAKSNNKRAINFLREIISGNANSETAKNIYASGINIGLVDCSSEGYELPEKEGGVGLARKTGMDIALTKFDYKNGNPNVLICLDADCIVSRDYLSSIVEAFQKKETHAAYVQYEHKLPEREPDRSAIICYELFLRYYLLGLKYAGSPFAFPTIGSTMVCDCETYIKIGGMNKKKAAEDFYFMEKLGKITDIKKIESAKVFPSSRGSWRVPFGTGQRVNRFFAGTHKEYLLYDPESFEILKKWLDLFYSDENYTAQEYLNRASAVSESLHKFLNENLFAESWNKIIDSSKSEAQIEKQKTLWFDGFKTLKLIHFLRDDKYPQINMFGALDGLLSKFERSIERNNESEIPPMEIQEQYLNLLRQIT